MTLHRDIYWVGRQWAVTGYGVQACDQRQKSKFDIEASRLWEDDVVENLRALAWLNVEDFEKALAVARKRFPEPPRNIVSVAEAVALSVMNGNAAACPPAAKLEEAKPQTAAPLSTAKF